MTRWITAQLRQLVAERANFLCEYCLIGEADSFYGCEVDYIISFFNPRLDRWTEHFVLEQAVIRPLTNVGEVTARILQFNTGARLHEREEMIRFGKYPSEPALAFMRPE